jgi:hypothetical protein
MAIVTDRESLINHCLRALGEPFLQINVAPEQLDDKVDDALQVYQEFHDDATRRNYYQYKITSQDVTNGYVSLPATVLYVIRLLPVSSSFINSSNMFSFQYQFAMSDMNGLGWAGVMQNGMSEYVQTKQYMELLDMTLSGTPQINFVRHANRVYIWGDFIDFDIIAGDWVCFEVMETLDPELNKKIYNDMFMKQYTTALIRYQWGQNLSKYEGVQLPGGVVLTGQQMKEEAAGELVDLRERMRLEQEKPIDFLVG